PALSSIRRSSKVLACRSSKQWQPHCRSPAPISSPCAALPLALPSSSLPIVTMRCCMPWKRPYLLQPAASNAPGSSPGKRLPGKLSLHCANPYQLPVARDHEPQNVHVDPFLHSPADRVIAPVPQPCRF